MDYLKTVYLDYRMMWMIDIWLIICAVDRYRRGDILLEWIILLSVGHSINWFWHATFAYQ